MIFIGKVALREELDGNDTDWYDCRPDGPGACYSYRSRLHKEQLNLKKLH